MVLAGNRGFWKYEGRGPPKLPLLPEKLAGRRVREDVEKERCDWGRRKRAVVVLPARRAALGGGSEGIVRCEKASRVMRVYVGCLARWPGVANCSLALPPNRYLCASAIRANDWSVTDEIGGGENKREIRLSYEK